ncbi:hypothetical protein EI42_05567 [Thermosporothrix hazakensis]|jgi:energy-coupling factor transporter transmembrane protein EcfT|uniref:Uncharacterized protein n=1 Tax=Thermosporothrix hazakensis TaxID=644383 RepID=A0A326U1L6_THEHA|nr:hypothetical protein [Thermosporothrix hazakensis]PZW22166.1 hypothetical protein EI42_05567 [Thermosporothrix hazakensis]GCE48111.1 hypothetical protein KTH_29800 [Thermosporothrix hazakensis]
MDDIRAILVNLVSNLLWLPIGVLLAYLGFFFQVRLPHRRLWQLYKPSHLVICAANSTTTRTDVYNRPATGIGQVRAIALALQSLHSAYHKQLDVRNILLSTEPLHQHIEEDLLILGGPKNNQIAEKLLHLLNEEQPAMQIQTTIYWRNKTNKGPMDRSGSA